jgi:hypothetical protein
MAGRYLPLQLVDIDIKLNRKDICQFRISFMLPACLTGYYFIRLHQLLEKNKEFNP